MRIFAGFLTAGRLGGARIALWVAALLLALPPGARAQNTVTPDGEQMLIQRNVGSERWAISYSFGGSTITGNVFKADGGAPSFVSCAFTDIDYAEDPFDSRYFLDCWGADTCSALPCGSNQWTLIATGIELPASFVLAPGTKATFGGNIEPFLDRECSSCHSGTNPAGELDLAAGASFANTVGVLSSDSSGLLIKRFAPQESLLATILQTAEGPGNPHASATPASVANLVAWIAEGAQEN
jgi:hypothetical protein